MNTDFLKDCGFNPSWFYKCSQSNFVSYCVDNRSKGAWVPYSISYRNNYELCKAIKESTGNQFNQEFDNSYR